MIQNILAAAFSGKYAQIEDLTSTILSETSGYFKFDITRFGLLDGATFTVTLEPGNNAVISTGDPAEFTSMDLLETLTDSISFTLDPAIISGTQVQFIVSVDNGDYVVSDTLTKIYGQAVVIFEDDCNTLTNWTSNQWDVTTDSYHSPTGSITDSPYGNYSNYQTNTITMNNEIDLTNAGYALLNFWAKWEIEAGWDYVQVLASTNGGSTWTPLEGNYTTIGSSNQAQGEPLYDGFQTQWVQEEIDLNEFIGSTVKFKFWLISDSYVTEDGYYFDDFTVTIVDIAIGEKEIKGLNCRVMISNPIPNPAKGDVKFNFVLPEDIYDIKFNIYNSAGQTVYSSNIMKEQSKISISVKEWQPGIYYYKIEGVEFQTAAKKLIVIR